MANPTITSFSPGAGAAGVTLTILGTGFETSPVAVDIGGNPATNVVVASDTSLSCTVPAGTGIVSVGVVNGAGNTTAVQQFTYAAYPVSYLMGRTRDLLLGSTREQINQLTSPQGAGDTTFTFSYDIGKSGIGSNATLAIDDELIHVWSVTQTSSGGTAVVQRGMYGTTATAHPAGSLVYVNPYFSRYEVRKTLMDEIRSWGPEVYAVFSTDLNSADFVEGYDLGALGSFYEVLDVSISPDTLLGTPSDKMWPELGWEVRQLANTSDFPSGNALFITTPGGIYDSPRTIHVVYAAPFNVDSTNGVGSLTFQDDDDVIATVGIDQSDLDIAPLGAAWRLMSGREIRRNLFEPMQQDSDLQNIPALANIRAAEELKKLRDSRLEDAKRRLRAKFPIRRGA